MDQLQQQPLNKQSKFTFKSFIVVLVMLILITVFIILLFKIKVFMHSYNSCVDDFAIIEQCKCLPLEGNYSYLKGMLPS
jgi:hypothetical protein